jgi:tRNA modification GTPase
VGKSSLLNLLLGFDRAIVTQIPGTTRDTLEELAHLRNIPVKLIDTAGIREADDLIEGMGIDRSKQSIKQAQIVFWLLDASVENTLYEFEEMKKHVEGRSNVICVWNKIDACPHASLPGAPLPTVEISVAKNTGIEKLLDAFEKAAWGFPHTEEPEIAVSSRHAVLLNEAASALPEAAEKIITEDWELAATNLRSAISALGAITGEDADPDVLDNIFSRFCIGK